MTEYVYSLVLKGFHPEMPRAHHLLLLSDLIVCLNYGEKVNSLIH